MNKRKILISGAGIAGTTLVYWLNQYNFDVTVLEKAPLIRKGGYRVDIRGTAIQVIARMGILDKINKNATLLRGSSMIDGNGKILVDINDPDLFGMRAPGDIEIMRGDLADVLYEKSRQTVRYIFNDTITGIQQSAEDVTVAFKNGETRNYDLLVAADGLHSNVRNLVFGNEAKLIKNLGYYVAIFSMSNQLQLDRWELAYRTEGKLINIYNLQPNDKAKVFLMFAAENLSYDYQNTGQQKSIVTDYFKGSCSIAAALIEAMQLADDFYFDSVSQIHVQSFFNDRVVLLGDAGYCASPASGQGTSLALVGAYTLAGELFKSPTNHQLAFNNYEQHVRGFIALNQKMALTVLADMVPKSKRAAIFQTNVLRWLMRLPFKQSLFKAMLKKMQQAVNRASNGITLKDY